MVMTRPSSKRQLRNSHRRVCLKDLAYVSRPACTGTACSTSSTPTSPFIDAAEVTDTYFALMDRLGTDGLLTAVSAAPTRPLAFVGALGVRDDIYGALRSLCFLMLAVGERRE